MVVRKLLAPQVGTNKLFILTRHLPGVLNLLLAGCHKSKRQLWEKSPLPRFLSVDRILKKLNSLRKQFFPMTLL